MYNSMNYLPTVKINVIGNVKVGKTTLSNLIADYSKVLPSEYRPTAGCRILEFEKEFTVEASKNYKFLKGGNRCKVQLWDVSGDVKYEKCWPAIQQEAQGAIVVIDNKNFKFENELDFWVNKFCRSAGLPLQNLTCMNYRKTDEKNEKPRTSNQFPQLEIFDVDFDVSNVLPVFNNFISKVMASLSDSGKVEEKKGTARPAVKKEATLSTKVEEVQPEGDKPKKKKKVSGDSPPKKKTVKKKKTVTGEKTEKKEGDSDKE